MRLISKPAFLSTNGTAESLYATSSDSGVVPAGLVVAAGHGRAGRIGGEVQADRDGRWSTTVTGVVVAAWQTGGGGRRHAALRPKPTMTAPAKATPTSMPNTTLRPDVASGPRSRPAGRSRSGRSTPDRASAPGWRPSRPASADRAQAASGCRSSRHCCRARRRRSSSPSATSARPARVTPGELGRKAELRRRLQVGLGIEQRLAEAPPSSGSDGCDPWPARGTGSGRRRPRLGLILRTDGAWWVTCLTMISP